MRIGPFSVDNKLILAPMAGVTDRPFRQLCKRLGAGMAVSEMVTSNPKLWGSVKTQRRLDHDGETEPRVVQIAGTEPSMMAHAALYNVDRGAQIIDINMGCPAKKVCNKMAGSALLQDELLVAKILHAVVGAVNVPVTLKIRTGTDQTNKNGTRIARIAEDSGIKALAVHGRTRACAYKGEAEYSTIRDIKNTVQIPVIANGDINSPQKAKKVLEFTGADAIMIGRAAQGRPWLFRETEDYLRTGKLRQPPSHAEVCEIMLSHLQALYAFYGEYTGVRVARKHVGWYLKQHKVTNSFRQAINRLETAGEQLEMIQAFFEGHHNNNQVRREVA